MVSVFNRKRLATTFSGDERAEICGHLEAAGVEYAVKTVNRRAAFFGRSGSKVPNEYIIYVSQKNFQIASDML